MNADYLSKHRRLQVWRSLTAKHSVKSGYGRTATCSPVFLHCPKILTDSRSLVQDTSHLFLTHLIMRQNLQWHAEIYTVKRSGKELTYFTVTLFWEPTSGFQKQFHTQCLSISLPLELNVIYLCMYVSTEDLFSTMSMYNNTRKA